MIGDSMAIKKVLDDMKRIAGTENTSVLILGESGTGKELVAHGIHHMSNRRKNLFHSVNCSAITDSLFESEFFGHKKGSFTGAFDDRSGWFEVTDKGTLFLDEIGDMPIGQQAKLLRTLEEHTVSKVGSHQSIKVDVRVIAASNQFLEKMIGENKFRKDLFHRLSTFVIYLPPLRERTEDIPILSVHFMNFFAQRMKKNISSIHPNAIEKLKAYKYPGNIRELRNIIERAVILCDDVEININHLDRLSLEKRSDISPDEQVFDLEQVEKITIANALKKCEYNKSRAADLLNISWQALNRKIKQWEIKDSE
jgi:transcriptional regulator with PAS, ATPase and Fis domain